jgi:hypothetical protein
MKWIGPAWLLLLVAVGGCQGGTTAAAEEPKAEAPAVPAVPAPARVEPTDVGLVRQGGIVRVGDTWQTAREVFPQPSTAFEFDDLPERFRQTYKARGWETAKEGFGVITYQGRIVSAMHQTERATQDQLKAVLDTYRERLGPAPPTEVEGRQVRYYFFEREGQRLMVSAFQGDGDGIRLTEAMGVDEVLNALGINPETAQRDRDRLDQSFLQRAGTPAKKP